MSRATPRIWAHLDSEAQADFAHVISDELLDSGMDPDVRETFGGALSKCPFQRPFDLAITTLPALNDDALVALSDTAEGVILLNTATLDVHGPSAGKAGATGAVQKILHAGVQNETVRDALVALGLTESKIQLDQLNLATTTRPSFSSEDRRDFATPLAGRPCLFACQTPWAEIDMILDAYGVAKRTVRQLILILDPADERDAPKYEQKVRERGFYLTSRADDVVPDRSTEVIVTDGAFEGGLWYSLANASYLGGSLLGDQFPSPNDAVSAGSAILVGPNAQSDDKIKYLKSHNAVTVAPSPDVLADHITTLVRPEVAAQQAQNGWDLVADSSTGLAVVLAHFKSKT